MKLIRKIIVVGGGTAGCISALLLKTRFPQFDVQIIESTKIGIVGVGESSTEHWAQFCQFVGINVLDAVLHCNGTFKQGVYFEGWAERDFMHNISYPVLRTFGDYYGVYAHLISNNCSPLELCDNRAYINQVGLENFNHLNDSPTYQFHFDTFALNEFLHRECVKRGISVIKEDIIEVRQNEDDEIKSVVTDQGEYNADFFIDCSGFKKLLLHETYGIEWKSYEEYLPLNSAIAFATEEMEEYNKYTKCTSRDAGWSWTIPTQTRTGNGYVYCDRFINRDQAHEEMERSYGEKISIAREFKFVPGRLEKSWHKNCFAVGLSQSFVEPLEATSIGSVIQQVSCFMHYLPSMDRETCNRKVNDIFENIVDYVQAHYLTKREDTPFWREVKYNLKLTNNLENYLNVWKERLPLANDIDCTWGMFKAFNYIPILYGLEWFNVDRIREEYHHFYSYSLGNEIQCHIESTQASFMFPMSHKKFISQLTQQQ